MRRNILRIGENLILMGF